MISKEEAKEMVLELFEEEALVIGGLAAVHNLEDDLVWRLMKNMDVILAKTIKRLEAEDTPERTRGEAPRPNTRPHPAIEEFLLKLRRA